MLPDDYISDEALPPRSSQDFCTNQYGTLLLDFVRQTGLRIMNGRIGADAGVGKYTYVGSAGCSLVDYVISSVDIMRLFHSFEVTDPNILSDHCEVRFSLLQNNYEFIEEVTETVNNKNNEYIKFKYKWNTMHTDEYCRNVSSIEFQNSLGFICESLNDITENCDIDTNIGQFLSLIDQVCEPLFKVNLSNHSFNPKFKDEKHQQWFDEECKQKRNTFYNCLDAYRFENNNINRVNMCKSRSEYKNTIRRKRYAFRKGKTDQLLQMKYTNAKKYWSMLKEVSHVSYPKNITADMFSKYFKAINNPDDPFYQADEDIIYFNDRFMRQELDVMFEELETPMNFDEI
jgi:hypothetical protein